MERVQSLARVEVVARADTRCCRVWGRERGAGRDSRLERSHPRLLSEERRQPACDRPKRRRQLPAVGDRDQLEPDRTTRADWCDWRPHLVPGVTPVFF